MVPRERMETVRGGVVVLLADIGDFVMDERWKWKRRGLCFVGTAENEECITGCSAEDLCEENIKILRRI